MKPFLYFSVAVAITSSVLAEAPDTLDGYLYYERGNYAGASPSFEESASIFSGDGTFSQIYARLNLSDRGESIIRRSPLQLADPSRIVGSTR